MVHRMHLTYLPPHASLDSSEGHEAQHERRTTHVSAHMHLPPHASWGCEAQHDMACSAVVHLMCLPLLASLPVLDYKAQHDMAHNCNVRLLRLQHTDRCRATFN